MIARFKYERTDRSISRPVSTCNLIPHNTSLVWLTFHVHLVFYGGLKVPFFVTFCQMSVTSFNTQCKRRLHCANLHVANHNQKRPLWNWPQVGQWYQVTTKAIVHTCGILWLTLFTSKCDKPGVVKQRFTDQEVVDVPLSELRKSE